MIPDYRVNPAQKLLLTLQIKARILILINVFRIHIYVPFHPYQVTLGTLELIDV